MKNKFLRLEKAINCVGIRLSNDLSFTARDNPIQIDLKIYEDGSTEPLCPYLSKSGLCSLGGNKNERGNCYQST